MCMRGRDTVETDFDRRHQAQLRLSLASSPNLSVKVFSTGRLQIAGCHDETSCMEAVRIVAHALNDIFERSPSIMKRQVKAGQDPAGVKLDGKIDINKLPLPKIVMINCSFDSVRFLFLPPISSFPPSFISLLLLSSSFFFVLLSLISRGRHVFLSLIRFSAGHGSAWLRTGPPQADGAASQSSGEQRECGGGFLQPRPGTSTSCCICPSSSSFLPPSLSLPPISLTLCPRPLPFFPSFTLSVALHWSQGQVQAYGGGSQRAEGGAVGSRDLHRHVPVGQGSDHGGSAVGGSE